MNIVNYHKFACFAYKSVESSLYKLGDVVFKPSEFEGEDVSEIGIIIQIHNEHEYRTDMFGNCCSDEIHLATIEEIETYRIDLLAEVYNKVFQPRTFFVLTEEKRLRGRISFYIGEIIDGKMKLIDNDFSVSKKSRRSLESEAINRLVQLQKLDEKYVDSGGYIKYDIKDYNIIHVESTNVAYLNCKYID